MFNSNHQKYKLIISGILAIALYFLIVRPIIATIKYRYSSVFNDYRHYAWVLNDTIKLDTLFSGMGSVRKSDQYYTYLLKDHTFIEIYEYTSLNSIKLKNVMFESLSHFPSFKHMWGTVLNKDLGKEVPIVSVKDKLPFKNTLKVDFNKDALLKIIRDTHNSKVYFGKLDKMLLSNAENDPLVLFDFSKVSRTLIAFYTARSKFLIVIITSDRKPLDEGCINLLNLD